MQIEHPSFDDSCFQYHLPQIYRSVLKRFRRITQAIVALHLIFFSVFILSFAIFFLMPKNPSMVALMLGALFLVGFSYLVLFFYYQAKKPEQIAQLHEQFLQACRQHVSLPPGDVQHHLSIAEALTKFSSYLFSFESNFYQLPSVFQNITPLLNRFSAVCYWEDVFMLRRLLLQSAIEEHLKQIRVTPTDLELHASLASAYVAQSLLYRSPAAVRDKKNRPFLEERFRSAARLAIEEFRILSYYAPKDPWVHEQLAKGYNQLEMPAEEMAEIETLLTLRPHDKEILFQLGVLYFQQGMNARGLQIYEELKRSHFQRAEELISSYGASLSER
jgi:hypothetical protein